MRVRPGVLLLFLLFTGSLIILAINLVEETSRYSTFEEALASPGKTFHIIGELCPEKKFRYDPLKDPNYMEFCMVDREGTRQWVAHFGAPPQDFNMVEEVAINAYWDNERKKFIATRILLKCPSKYIDQEAPSSTL